MASDDGGDRDLTGTVVAPMSIADIWLGLTLVDNDYGARAESCGGGKRLLSQD